jgi:hypothetical protein
MNPVIASNKRKLQVYGIVIFTPEENLAWILCFIPSI